MIDLRSILARLGSSGITTHRFFLTSRAVVMNFAFSFMFFPGVTKADFDGLYDRDWIAPATLTVAKADLDVLTSGRDGPTELHQTAEVIDGPQRRASHRSVGALTAFEIVGGPSGE